MSVRSNKIAFSQGDRNKVEPVNDVLGLLASWLNEAQTVMESVSGAKQYHFVMLMSGRL